LKYGDQEYGQTSGMTKKLIEQFKEKEAKAVRMAKLEKRGSILKKGTRQSTFDEEKSTMAARGVEANPSEGGGAINIWSSAREKRDAPSSPSNEGGAGADKEFHYLKNARMSLKQGAHSNRASLLVEQAKAAAAAEGREWVPGEEVSPSKEPRAEEPESEGTELESETLEVPLEQAKEGEGEEATMVRTLYSHCTHTVLLLYYTPYSYCTAVEDTVHSHTHCTNTHCTNTHCTNTHNTP
jgi:hypothetical protein